MDTVNKMREMDKEVDKMFVIIQSAYSLAKQKGSFMACVSLPSVNTSPTVAG